MTSINTTDILFATIISRGSRITSIKLSGISSYNELLKAVSRHIKGYVGLVTLQLRNHSQGWSRTSPLLIHPAI